MRTISAITLSQIISKNEAIESEEINTSKEKNNEEVNYGDR